nr:hypothetical protein [Sphingomonas cavernae]
MGERAIGKQAEEASRQTHILPEMRRLHRIGEIIMKHQRREQAENRKQQRRQAREYAQQNREAGHELENGNRPSEVRWQPGCCHIRSRAGNVGHLADAADDEDGRKQYPTYQREQATDYAHVDPLLAASPNSGTRDVRHGAILAHLTGFTLHSFHLRLFHEHDIQLS